MRLGTYSPPDERTMDIFRKMGGDDFDRMRTYLFDMHNSMLNQKAILGKSHQEELKLFPQSAELTNRVHRQYQENYDTHFVGLLLNSALLVSSSLFETIFKKICFYAAATKNIELRKDHFGRNAITEKCNRFIVSEIGLNLKPIEKYWKRLQLYKEMRNKIAHHEATIPARNKPLRKFVRKSDFIFVHNRRTRGDLTFYIKDRLFIYDFLEISSSYLIWILMRLKR